MRVIGKGRALPDDWKPSERHYSEAVKLNLNNTAVDRMAEDMRLWARANANRAVARKADWDATFSNWLRRNLNGGKQSSFKLSSGLEGVL